jgi:hypothetical protein
VAPRACDAGAASETARTARAAKVGVHRLDDVFRWYLVERPATRTSVEDAAALVSGAGRVRCARADEAAILATESER